jgi:hypothetical protein
LMIHDLMEYIDPRSSYGLLLLTSCDKALPFGRAFFVVILYLLSFEHSDGRNMLADRSYIHI